VIGYGSQTKKELTGSIANVRPEDFNNGEQANALGLVQGKVAGLMIVKDGGGDPARNTYQVQLRGLGSLHGSGSPLFVIDGVAGGDLSTVPAGDIESIDVLKDGSAAAIYGVRANHGVILVTTKRGKSGEVTVSYAGDFGVGFIAKRPRVLTASEYRKYMVATGLGIDYGGNTDWISEMIRPSNTTSHHLSTTGGTKEFNYRASVGYKASQGLAICSDFSQINGKIAADQWGFNNKLHIQYDLSYFTDKKNWVDYYAFDRAVQANPTLPLRFAEDDPDYEKYNGWYELNEFDSYNPVAKLKEPQDLQKSSTLLGSVRATLNLTDNWRIGTNVSLQDINSWNGKYDSRYMKGDYINGVGKAEQIYGYSRMQTIESTIQYINRWGKHNFQAIVGHSYQTFEQHGFRVKNNDFPVDFTAYNNLGMGKGIQTGDTNNVSMGSYKYIDKGAAFFTRGIYNFNNRYFVNASVRTEGSSKFGPKAHPTWGRWGIFPAVSGSWLISEEDFLKKHPVIDNLKLRIGYGVTGNQPGGNQSGDHYSYLMRVGPTGGEIYLDGEWISPWGALSNENDSLRWEKKKEYNLGVDFILLKKLSGTVDAYLRNTTDLLWMYAVSVPPNPYERTLANYGQLRNMGIELTLNYQIVRKKDFNWNVGLVMAKNANKVVRITGGEFANNNAGYLEVGSVWGRGLTGLNVMRLEEGRPVGNFYGYKFYDINKDGKMRFYTDVGGMTSYPQDKDRQVIGNAQPWATFGFNTFANYKQWSVSLNFRGRLGGMIFNEKRFMYENTTGAENVLLSAVDPAAAIASDRPAHLIKDQRHFSDFYLEKGTYLKLSDASVGYNFKLSPSVKAYMNSAKLLLTAQNLFTITGYSGMDPEVPIAGLAPGMDFKRYYPRQRSILLSLKATF
jgi:TonB-linked SusC/RagA family outer membrane protein